MSGDAIFALVIIVLAVILIPYILHLTYDNPVVTWSGRIIKKDDDSE